MAPWNNASGLCVSAPTLDFSFPCFAAVLDATRVFVT
jgi:hypothetical protein